MTGMSAQPVNGAEWQEVGDEERSVTPILRCKGCGATKAGLTGDPTDLFPSDHCDQCPPWRCPDCGQMDSAAAKCPCWIDLTVLPHADVKALFAADGTFNIAPDGTLSVG